VEGVEEKEEEEEVEEDWFLSEGEGKGRGEEGLFPFFFISFLCFLLFRGKREERGNEETQERYLM
jgi:hypothetical protein